MTPQISSLLRSLPALPYRDRRALPDCSGVYLVIAKNEVLYVGATKSVHQRLRSHENAGFFKRAGSVTIAWLTCEPSARKVVEQGLIRCCNPLLNAHHRNDEHGNRYREFEAWLLSYRRRPAKKR